MHQAQIKHRPHRLVWIFIVTLLSCRPGFADEESQIWSDVQSGKSLVILRHALAPGNGDPVNFDISRCETQRNLSEKGVQQAQRIGKALKQRGLENARVYTSQWCRCIDTAQAMDMHQATELPVLNSFYANPEAGPEQTRALLQWIKNLDKQQPVVLVTHQVVISALTGVFPTSGEAVVFTLKKDDSVEVVHRLAVK